MLWSLAVALDEQELMLGDNLSVVLNTTVPSSVLKKKGKPQDRFVILASHSIEPRKKKSKDLRLDDKCKEKSARQTYNANFCMLRGQLRFMIYFRLFLELVLVCQTGI
jgi:hypothetical protein